MLHSVGAPAHLAHLNRLWVRCAEHPTLNGRSHYVSCEDDMQAHIVWADGIWMLADGDLPYMLMYAISASPALHPNTILPGEWLAQAVWPGGWTRLDDFAVQADMTLSSPERPLRLDDVGVDLFLRRALAYPVWFVDPTTGDVQCSSAKASAAPGRRFCAICDRAYSANNFVSQHMRKVHADLPAPRVRSCHGVCNIPF